MKISKDLMIIISGPSGSGKTTVRNLILDKSDEFHYSVSATTRDIKEKEIDGKDYHFITKEKFQSLIDGNAFIEYNNYSGNFYGTLKSEVFTPLENGKIVVFDVDVNGAVKLMELFPEAVSIWLLPPSYKILRSRLYSRKRESDSEIERRLEIAKKEMDYFYKYDYLVVNNENKAATAANQILKIVECEKLKTKRNETFYENFINKE